MALICQNHPSLINGKTVLKKAVLVISNSGAKINNNRTL